MDFVATENDLSPRYGKWVKTHRRAAESSALQEWKPIVKTGAKANETDLSPSRCASCGLVMIRKMISLRQKETAFISASSQYTL